MSIEKNLFGRTKNNDEVFSLILKNKNELQVEILTYGATLRSILVKDKDGIFRDVLLGHSEISDYETISSYIGATIGRFANRIDGGKFSLDGKEYILAKNDKSCHLHGGNKGYNDYVWEITDMDASDTPSVTLSHNDIGANENYPGNVKASLTFSLSEDNTLSLHYKAETDKRTVINLTNHAYFNLNGFDGGEITEHFIKMDADSYTPITESLIPTGEIKNVAHTPFDFRSFKKIGQELNSSDEDIKKGGGYDHNFVLNAPSLEKASISVYSDKSSIGMCVYTDMPAVQLYSGNFLDGSQIGKDGKPITKRTGFCLETQYFPDTPNQPNFPSCVLNPGEIYDHTTIFKFVSADEIKQTVF